MSKASNVDKWQTGIHDRFQATHWLCDEHHVYRLLDWVTFYRRNLHRLVGHYLGLRMHLYQMIILYLMNINPSFCFVAARAAAKSYIIAVYACARAILYPHSQIVIASGTKGQASLIVSVKIQNELMRDSPMLCKEIRKVLSNENRNSVTFHNGSTIEVVPATENARGHRATVMIYEEFRQITRHMVDTVLSPMLINRQSPYINDPAYASMAAELVEEPISIYISSSWYRSHWMWGLMKQSLDDMLKDGSTYMLCTDYAITLKHNIRSKMWLMNERKKLDSMSWLIEYCNQMIAENTKAYFSYKMLSDNQRLKKAFYPRTILDYISNKPNKYAIPKQDGEIRIITVDVAMAGGSENDNSVYGCMRLLPEKMNFKSQGIEGHQLEVKQGYRRQLVYLEAVNGLHTEKQAIRIKQLFRDFSADYCVLDMRSQGLPLYDSLAKVLYDEERDSEYPAWLCINDDDAASRIQIAGALPVVYAVYATAKLNSDIAVVMRDCLTSKKIDLLVGVQDVADDLVKRIPEYANGTDLDTQIFYERPFLETAGLVNEMIALEYERGEQTGAIRIREMPGMRKDRYTSVSYGNYFADLLEKDLLHDNSEYEFIAMYN